MTDPPRSYAAEEVAWWVPYAELRRRIVESIAAGLAEGCAEWTNGRGLFAAVSSGLGAKRLRVTRYDVDGLLGHCDADDAADELYNIGTTRQAKGSMDALSRRWP